MLHVITRHIQKMNNDFQINDVLDVLNEINSQYENDNIYILPIQEENRIKFKYVISNLSVILKNQQFYNLGLGKNFIILYCGHHLNGCLIQNFNTINEFRDMTITILDRLAWDDSHDDMFFIQDIPEIFRFNEEE